MDPRNELAERVFGRRLKPTTQRCSEVGQAFSPVNTQVIDLRHVGQVDDLPWVAHNARYILLLALQSTRLGSNPPVFFT